ncbi:Rv3235 family protein [Streptomyces anulatus]|uniref:Rv3235 family protein n=1 Tax=Streptomyces anulatus TaxID=1892 RepID=UPI002E821A21|nr:Rv3235 family protein [Streptomyces anulatus]WUC88952.1 Rv3235 family protein [Streptomyces anulatus]
MSTDRTRPAGRRDQGGPRSVPPQRSRRQQPHRPQRPHQWFAERLLAVLSGQRPVHWMLGHTIGEAYDQLAELAPSTPLGSPRGSRPVLRHCRGAQPATGVVEAFASIAEGDRVRAMAFRLEQGPDQRWRCAAVELGGERLTAGAPGPR